MSSPRDELNRLGGEGTVGGVLGGFRERFGRGWSRAAARVMGVSQRTIQRAARGDTRHPKFSDTGQFRGAAAADAIRSATSVTGGSVSVEYDGRDEGDRRLPDMEITGDLRAALDHVADLLDEGDVSGAADALSEAMLNEYEDGLGENLSISNFIDGLRFD